MKTTLYDVLIKNADFIIHNEPRPGHNGPYSDTETIIRVYSHWAILLLKVFQITGKNQYKDRAIEFINYFFSNDARPYGFTFHHRNKKKKDKCNGLIGQAWTIEALIYAYEVLGNNKYKGLAEEVFLLHKFNNTIGFWRKREIDGTNLWFDMTFNHQLWFAMIGALIPNQTIKQQVNRFMDRLDNNIWIHQNGLIRHFILAGVTTPIYLAKKSLLNRNINKNYLYEKEIGYHAFNCYALSVLKEKYPNQQFWGSNTFMKIMDYIISDEHLSVSEKNKYGFPYNPSGIETAFFVFMFKDLIINHEEIMKERLEVQFKRSLDVDTGLLINNTNDPNNLSARIYEAVRLPNIDLQIL